MSHLRHPNIVQFLGVYFIPGSSMKIPMLVMEYLHASLNEILESTPHIPLHYKWSILHDIALGLAYLHGRTPPVIHRDLTARNIMLSSDMRAKLADFGVSRIINLEASMLEANLSRIPGTISYMPPEVFGRNVSYDTSVDIFAFGHLALYTLAQVFPTVVSATYIDEDSGKVVACTEFDRRIGTFQRLAVNEAIYSDHPLSKLMQQCLENDPKKRPSIGEVLQRLEDLEVKKRIENPYGSLNRLQLEQMLCGRLKELKECQSKLEQAKANICFLERERTGKENGLTPRPPLRQSHSLEVPSSIAEEEPDKVYVQDLTIALIKPKPRPQLRGKTRSESDIDSSPTGEKHKQDVTKSQHQQVQYSGTAPPLPPKGSPSGSSSGEDAEDDGGYMIMKRAPSGLLECSDSNEPSKERSNWPYSFPKDLPPLPQKDNTQLSMPLPPRVSTAATATTKQSTHYKRESVPSLKQQSTGTETKGVSKPPPVPPRSPKSCHQAPPLPPKDPHPNDSPSVLAILPPRIPAHRHRGPYNRMRPERSI